MERKKLKTLREEAEAALAEGIGNKEQLFRAVPALVALQNAVKSAKASYDETKAIADALSDACSEYALSHKGFVFGETIAVSPVGVESGDVEIDGETYHFKHGFGGYGRTDAKESMSQSFLRSLPEGWAKTRLEIDKSGIKAANPSPEDLAAFGLKRKVNDTWSKLD